MVMKRCPHCDSVYAVAPNSGDFVHQCNTQGVSESLANEDVPRLGAWSDYSGSGAEGAPANLLGLNIPNNRGIKYQNYTWTNRGNRVSTHRTRRHEEYIEN